MAVSRKTVTVLFADVADSTGLGERLDPEAVRRALGRWFEVAREIIERHGGTVEKFIGDAVMAVFGVPQLHEDDAVRAVRAADELLVRLGELNDDLERQGGVRLRVRVGVNTGEVVTGDGSGTLVTGDAVNVAKRLEEAAQAGEVLLGAETLELVRDTGRFEPLGALPAKGKQDPVAAWRIVSLDRTAPPFARRFETPLVGRRRELDHLRRAYARAVYERTCHLFTLLGPAGIGKSRIATELFDALASDATILVGRCLPYGDGITFWPVTQILRDFGGDAAIEELVAATDDGELIAERLAGLTGHAAVGAQETFWAVRRVCEELARRQPLVLCFEDVHWAEPTLLDLVEYLAGWIHDVPMLLLCLARPEFLEERPQWLAAGDNAASLTLTPLSSAESEELLDVLGTGHTGRERIVSAAEGNPLYVEQMAAMVAEGGFAEGLFRVPPTIQTLLAARLDRLGADERVMLERAAVCGREFWRGAIVHLTPPEARDTVGPTLLSLVRKDLIKPGRLTRRADDSFRFAHTLVRDAAYARISKEARATLHEEFALWLGASVDDTIELDELLGYHFEQAVRARRELGVTDEQTRVLGARGAALLGGAGRRALVRSDIPAALNLLERAVFLAEAARRSAPALLLDLGNALRQGGELARADAVLADAIAAAEAHQDVRQAERASIERVALRLYVDPGFELDEAQTRARAAIQTFTRSGDELGLARAWRLIADVDWARLRLTEMEASLEQALEHAKKAGDQREASEITRGLCRVALLGPTPVDEAIARCREALDRDPDDLGLQATVHEVLSVLLAAKGHFFEAHDLLDRARRAYDELGLGLRAGAMYAAFVDLLAGEYEAAERELRHACAELEAIGERSELSTTAALLAVVLCKLGRFDEAERSTDLAVESSSPGDIASQVIVRRGRAKILAARGDLDAALRLAHLAVEQAETTDWLQLRADALIDLAELEQGGGAVKRAETSVRRALSLYEKKGIDVAAERARAQLSQLVGA
jgi:class 3 adenylate cyclase/tetratricopeptide (TPR) repeat protein